MRGLEFRGTYCQQREVEAISEGVEDNQGTVLQFLFNPFEIICINFFFFNYSGNSDRLVLL